MSTANTIYRLKITLAEINPPVWRLVDVEDCALLILHKIIQVSMGWDNKQEWEFYIAGKQKARRNFWCLISAPGSAQRCRDEQLAQ